MFSSIRRFSLQSVSIFITIIIFSSISFASNDPKKTDLAVVTGTAYLENTIKAVDALGGMKNFVSKGSKVGLLINSDFENKGAYVNPDISIAVIKMCFDAGAKEVIFIQSVLPEYWKRSNYYDQYKDMIAKCVNTEINRFPSVFNEKDFVKANIVDGIILKEAEVIKVIFDCDVFINIPIAKHHATTFLTGALKNMMGISSRATNILMHRSDKTKNEYGNFSQCIADLNLLKKTNLCIVDATEVITTNGPDGPGEIKKLDKVIASADIVATDAYCAGLLGYAVEDVLAIEKASKHGLGEMDLEKVNIKEIEN